MGKTHGQTNRRRKGQGHPVPHVRRLDHPSYLPSGDVALTRSAKNKSEPYAVGIPKLSLVPLSI